MTRVTKLVLGLVLAAIGWLTVPSGASAVVLAHPAQVYTYDARMSPEWSSLAANERGSPTPTYDYTAAPSVGDHGARGSLGRPQPSSAWAYTTYDDLVRFVQSDSVRATTLAVSDGHAASLRATQGVRCAANSVRSAAPSAFTRAEALSGRASQRTVNEIAESMRTNGWQGAPIDVVELNGQRIVVDGHHRLAAARRAGIDVQHQVVDPSTVIRPGKYSSVDDILRSTYSVGRNRLR